MACVAWLAHASRRSLPRVVPAFDHSFLTLEAEHGDGGRFEHEAAPGGGGETDPTCTEDAQEMRVREHRDRAARGERALDDTVGSSTDIIDRLTTDDLMCPDRPAGNVAADVVGASTLVDAIVPFDGVGAQLDARTRARSSTRIGRTLQRTAQHTSERVPGQSGREDVSLPAPEIGQGQIGATRVATIAAPLGLTVTDEHQFMSDGHAP